METLESLRGQAQDRGSSNSYISGRLVVNRHMVTTAIFTAFQQQLRQEMTDVIQQLEMNETVSGRMDMLNSINAALQNVSAKSIASKPYRISDLIPRNWEGSNDKGWSGSTIARLQLIVQMRRSEQLKRRCTNSCTERQQTRR